MTSDDIDIEKTIEESALTSGFFSPIYESKQVYPEYLFLINRTTYTDHQAKLIDELLDSLNDQEVFTKRYYFERDPNICFPYQSNEKPISLQRLVQKHSANQLILFSDTSLFFNSWTGHLKQWVETISSWNNSVIFTTQPLAQWRQQELKLSEEFILLPLNAPGLAAITKSIQRGRSLLTPPVLKPRTPYPESLRIRPERWLQNFAPDEKEVDEMLTSLNRHLGPSGFLWMSACAVYPELKWDLTLFLGNELTNQSGEKLISTSKVISLAKLPWFRTGHMPDWLRIRLISDLNDAQEYKIRELLKNLFLSQVTAKEKHFNLELAHYDSKKLNNIFTPLLKLISTKSEENSQLKDHVFIKFMLGHKQEPLLVRLPKNLNVSLNTLRSGSLTNTRIQPNTPFILFLLLLLTLYLGFYGVVSLRVNQAIQESIQFTESNPIIWNGVTYLNENQVRVAIEQERLEKYFFINAPASELIAVLLLSFFFGISGSFIRRIVYPQPQIELLLPRKFVNGGFTSVLFSIGMYYAGSTPSGYIPIYPVIFTEQTIQNPTYLIFLAMGVGFSTNLEVLTRSRILKHVTDK